jgi:hypothetical protein
LFLNKVKLQNKLYFILTMEEKHPFDTFGLEPHELQTFIDAFNKLHLSHGFDIVDSTSIKLKKFESFRRYQEHYIREAIHVDRTFKLLIVNVSYVYHAPRGSTLNGEEFQLWGLAKLKKDFGHLFLKREGVAEKILELFNPLELDFESDAGFSRKYYVLAKDKQKAVETLTAPYREEIKNCRVRDFSIEILGDELLIGNYKCLDPETILDFTYFLKRVANIRE